MNYKILIQEKVKLDGITFFKTNITHFSSNMDRLIYIRHTTIQEMHEKLEETNQFAEELPEFPRKISIANIIHKIRKQKETTMLERLNKYFTLLLAKQQFNFRALIEFIHNQQDQMRHYILRDKLKPSSIEEMNKILIKLRKISKDPFIKQTLVQQQNENFVLKQFILPRVDVSKQYCIGFVNMHLSIRDCKNIVKVKSIFQVYKKSKKNKKSMINKEYPYEQLGLVSNENIDSGLQYLMALEDEHGECLQQIFDSRRRDRIPFDFVTIIEIIQSLTTALHEIHKIGDYMHGSVYMDNIFRSKEGIWVLGGAMEPIWRFREKWIQLNADVNKLILIPPDRREQLNSSQDKHTAQKGDIYQLGIILLQICTLCDSQDLLEALTNKHSLHELLKQVSDLYTEEFSIILNIMMDKHPYQRPSTQELLSQIFQTKLIPIHLNLFQDINQQQNWCKIDFNEPFQGTESSQIILGKPKSDYEMKMILKLKFMFNQTVSLDLKNSNINDQQLIDLESMMSQSRSFTLDISQNEEVTVEGFILFLNIMRENKVLKKLKIYATQFSQIDLAYFQPENPQDSQINITIITEQ